MFSADQIWNNLLKEIARQAFEAGGDHVEDVLRGGSPDLRAPGFEEWWPAFVKSLER